MIPSSSVARILLLLPLCLATQHVIPTNSQPNAELTKPHSHSHLLTPKSMLGLPRPGAGVASPDGKWSMSIVNHYDFDEESNQHVLYIVPLSLTSSHNPKRKHRPSSVLSWNSTSTSTISDPFWMSNTTIGYLNSTQKQYSHEIWSVQIPATGSNEGECGYGSGEWDFEELSVDAVGTEADHHSLNRLFNSREFTHVPTHLHKFPPSIFPSSIKYTSLPSTTSSSSYGILSFSASVHQSISSIYENEAAEKAYAARPDAGVVYDELFLREWDTWRVPGKVNQLFLVTVTSDGAGGVEREEAVKGKGREPVYLAPFNASGIYSVAAAPISDTAYDVAYSASSGALNVALIVKDQNLPVAFHTRQHLYSASVAVSDRASVQGDTKRATSVPAPNTPNSKVKTLTQGGQGAVSGVKFSPNGDHVAWLEMREDKYEADRNRVITYDLSTGVRTEWTEGWDRSPSDVIWSHTGETIYLIAESQAVHLPYHLSHPGHLPTPLLFNGTTTSLQVLSNTHLLLSKNTMTSPSEDFVLHLPDHSTGSDPDKSTEISLTQLTDWSTRSLAKLSLSAPQSFWFQGANDHPVNGWILFPPNYKSHEKYPLAFLIHGGPEGSWADSWSTRWNPQVYAAQGYVTVAINPTGSTGYGEEFTRAIRDDWGGKPFKDLMAGLDFVIATYPSIDTDNLFALGGSYGGYMINWIAGHNDGKLRFKALVNHDGVFDTQTMWYTTEQVYFQESENGNAPPWEKRSVYQKFNPTNFIQNWNTPTLVIHGGQDFRVPLGEGIGAFTALQRKGIPSRFLYFESENHWVLNPLNSIKWHHEVLKWLDEWKD